MFKYRAGKTNVVADYLSRLRLDDGQDAIDGVCDVNSDSKRQ